MKTKIYDLLFEAEELIDSPEVSLNMVDTELKARKALDSIDDQVDALILRYEASSIKEDSEISVASSLKESSLKYLLEQEEGEDPAATDTAGDEAATDPVEDQDPVGSEDMDVTKPAESQGIPNLDVDAFAARTVRLIKNYKSLLRIEEAIGNRIKHFLDENYGDKYVQRYLEVLENQYGLTFKEFQDERAIEDDDFAIGAFAGGTGGLGGGS